MARAEIGNRTHDLLRGLDVPVEVLDRRVRELAKSSLSSLQALGHAYQRVAIDLEPNKFGGKINDARIDYPPFGYNPAPSSALGPLRPLLTKTYHQSRDPQHASRGDLFARLLHPRTRHSARIARLLFTSSAVRAAFERRASGVLVVDGRYDGKITMRDGPVETSKSAFTAPPAPPSSALVYELLRAMDQAVLEQAAAMRPGNGSFVELGKGSLFAPSGASDSSRGLDGSNDGDPEGEEDDGEWASLGMSTIPPPLGTPDGAISSVDLGTLKLKRLIDKRDQMYDLYRQTFNKHDQTAKTAIDALRA